MNKTTKILASILSKGQSTRLMSGQLPYKLFLILKRYNLIILLFLAFFAKACVEEIQVPPPPAQYVDTVDKYTWEMDTIWGYMMEEIYVADSNNIFLNQGYMMMHYDGHVKTPISYNDPDFAGYRISGYNRNAVYVGGRNIASLAASLKIWNGGSFTTYIIPNDSSYSISAILVLDRYDAWLVTERYSIYHFQSGTFTKYRVDSLISIGEIFTDAYGSLYLFSTICRDVCCNNFMYKFINNRFELISIDSTNTTTDMMWGVYKVGNDIIRQGNSSLYYLQNNEWVKLCNTANFFPAKVSGYSKDNLICFGGNLKGPGMYIWNKNKWWIEKNFEPSHLFPLIPRGKMYAVDSNVYINFNYNYWWTTFLVTGKPKKGGHGK